MPAFTIGHSTRSIDELIKILLAYDVRSLVDVRRFPKSATNPQFNSETIDEDLAKHGLGYVWLEDLGGRREGFGDRSRNKCWKSKLFRNYADYMETTNFHKAAQKLIELTNNETVAIMCAEAVYWRCHRSMISDFLKSRGIDVIHIFDERHSTGHNFSECARIIDGQLTYHDLSTLDRQLQTPGTS